MSIKNVDAQLHRMIETWAYGNVANTGEDALHVAERMVMYLDALESDEYAYLIDKGLWRVYDEMIAVDGK